MKPYVDINGKKYLPQEVNPHRFEVCALESNGQTHYLLCPKAATRYVQATGVHMELHGNEFTIPVVNGRIVKRTFPLSGLQAFAIQVDWSAGGSISIQHDSGEPEEETQPAE